MTGYDLRVRLQLLGTGVCWAVIAIANIWISTAERWHPEWVAISAVIAMVTSVALAVRPNVVRAFRLAGAVGVATLLLRCVVIFGGLFIAGSRDIVWQTLAAIGVTLLAVGTYWRWWLTDVRQWHEVHRRISR